MPSPDPTDIRVATPESRRRRCRIAAVFGAVALTAALIGAALIGGGGGLQSRQDEVAERGERGREGRRRGHVGEYECKPVSDRLSHAAAATTAR